MFSAKKRFRARKTVYFLMVSLFVLIVVFVLLVNYVDSKLANKTLNIDFDPCQKIWATRGLVANGLETPKYGNSVATVNAAFDAGAKGTEVDLFFDPSLNRYVISHDRPYNLKEGKLLTLEELLRRVDAKHFFWLDLKKMSRLNNAELSQAVSRLNEVTQFNQVKSRLFIEGEDPINLAFFKDAGFNTIFDTQPLPEKYLTSYFVVNIYKIVFYFNGFTVMAMKAGESGSPIFGEKVSKLTKNVPMFIYHTPDNQKLLESLLTKPQVQSIILRDHSLNKYTMNGCSNDFVNALERTGHYHD